MDNTLIQIEMQSKEKVIHYMGYGYMTDEQTETPARWLDYTGLICPLKNAIKYGISEWERDNSEECKQYIEDITESELNKRYNEYPEIKESDITTETPCGTYFLLAESNLMKRYINSLRNGNGYQFICDNGCNLSRGELYTIIKEFTYVVGKLSETNVGDNTYLEMVADSILEWEEE